MTRLRSIVNPKLAVAVLVLAGLAAIYVESLPANDAALGIWVYYSDATYTTVVGARGTACCGEVVNWGITTKYKRFERIYCPTGICPN
jgi:hypothetical protein